eukprot:TRINITY_DN4285_c0_g1_i3.p1 TRINITY_DN4285_c0_g1~~TRINITY_DN4285_c0_g1_i3.p1  ORF type:complete len:158 (+),score=13.97 TRINITY_DN4285_c0_g1_i3:165-638(+)
MYPCDTSSWDPRLIIGQILSIQFFYYFTTVLGVIFLDFQFNQTPTVQQLFDVRLNFFDETRSSIVLLTTSVLFAPLGALAMLFIVGRPRKVLDFSLTRFLIHLIICCSFSFTFPVNLWWWLCHTIAVIVETVGGEYLCVRRELKKIPQGVNVSVLTV